MLETMYFQLDKMLEKPYEIAKQFATFKSNISSLGDWVFQISSQPLLLDTLELTVPDAPRREAEAGFFRQLAFNAELFLNSFLIDYNTAGQGADPLVVWVPTGRDQWQIISTLADNRFTTETGIPVSVPAGGPHRPAAFRPVGARPRRRAEQCPEHRGGLRAAGRGAGSVRL